MEAPPIDASTAAAMSALAAMAGGGAPASALPASALSPAAAAAAAAVAASAASAEATAVSAVSDFDPSQPIARSSPWDAATGRLPPSFTRLTFLGTVSAIPSPGRCNVSSALLQLSSGAGVMLDCGEATQHQVMRARGAKLSGVDAILITHLHGDHFFGIFGVLATMGATGRALPVVVVGPTGIDAAVRGMLGASYTQLPYPLQVIEVTDASPTELDAFFLHLGLRVTAVPIVHKVPTVGYAITELPRPGALDGAKAKAAGVKAGADMGRLKAGEDVVLEGGAVVRSQDVLGPASPGRKFVFLQDTSDASPFASPHLLDADVMVHEATFHAGITAEAIAHGHSTAEMAARFAFDTRAKNLILTHFSSRYEREPLVRDAASGKVKFGPLASVVNAAAAAASCCGGDATAATSSNSNPKQTPLSVLDLQAEAEAAIQAALATAEQAAAAVVVPKVLVAADFRVFEPERRGSTAWRALPDADLDGDKIIF